MNKDLLKGTFLIKFLLFVFFPGCKYTCHSQCQHRVVLDCQPGHGSTTETPLNQDQLNNNTQLTVSTKLKIPLCVCVCVCGLCVWVCLCVYVYVPDHKKGVWYYKMTTKGRCLQTGEINNRRERRESEIERLLAILINQWSMEVLPDEQGIFLIYKLGL